MHLLDIKFNPQYEPKEIIQMGSFGGIYFNYPGIDYRNYPSDWFENLLPCQYISPKYHAAVNYYGVKAGMNQQQWQNKGWIDSQAPRGWFQWYCDLYVGRPTINDKLQCGRWIRFDRWLVQYQKNPSPVIAQSLLHWAYKI